MNRDQKRFTISVTPELAAELTAAKQLSLIHISALPANGGRQKQTETR